MTLAVNRLGSGRDLVLLHGWGMNSAVWSTFADSLAERYRLCLIDLPGHGGSSYAGEQELQEWSAACLAVAPPRAVWVGWSLGAEIAIQAAMQKSERVIALIGMCGTPRFVQADDWPSAMSEQTLDQFITASCLDHRKTLERFLALQVRGSEQARECLRELKSQLQLKPEPNQEALAAGLELLKTVDLRNQLKQLSCPVAWLFGERDTLVPASVAGFLLDWLPSAETEVISGAAHAPFLTHLTETVEAIARLLEGIDAAG